MSAPASTTIVRRSAAPAPALPAHLHPVSRRVLAGRGITTAAACDTGLSGLHPATSLDGMEAAVDLIQHCMQEQSLILVVGDFDADGATSTALAVTALRAMGASAVDYLVPNRFEYGYGLTPEIVELACARNPALIITVDNGVSSIDGVAAAAAAGVRVLVTDHHLPGEQLPAAAAMVNPNLPADRFPSKCLAGVGVIFYVMTALRARLREHGWFGPERPEPALADLLDLVALGTVADVVPLDDNNRRLVAQGIARIRAGRCRPGITALVQVAGREQARLTTADLGFALGPRLNAAGRLADMALGIECLLSDDLGRASALADELDRLNRERRDIEGEMRAHAFALIEASLPTTDSAVPAAFCVAHEAWHQGVIGIVAARVKDRFHRPAIAFAPGEDGTLKGSARSIRGLHIRDALADLAAGEPDLIIRFGGHAMAAGLTLDASKLGRFRASFTRLVDARLDEDARARIVHTDGDLAAEDFNLELARELAALAPWGQGFPEPRFDGVFSVRSRRVVGTDHAKLVLVPEHGGATLEAIAFGAAGDPWFGSAASIRAVYKLDVNNYRGRDSLQLVLEHVEAIPELP